MTIHLIGLALFFYAAAYLPYSSARLEEPSFPDIFKLLIGRNGVQFQYELNSLVDNKVQSILVDEAYSIKQRAGRLVVNQDEAGKVNRRAFYLSRDNKSQFGHWLNPFVCSSVQTGLDQPAPKSGLLTGNLLPVELEHLMSYSRPSKDGLAFEGLTGLLANVLELHVKDLQYNAREFRGGNQSSAEWSLNTLGLDTIVELSFPNFDDAGERGQLEIEDFVGLFVTVLKEDIDEDRRRTVSIIAQITVLKAALEFPEAILNLPQGYSCRQSLSPPFNLYNSGPILSSSDRMSYTLQVVATVATDNNHLAPTSPSDQFSMLSPMDSMQRPQSSSSQLILIPDIMDQSISTISSREDSLESVLSIWDFKTKRKLTVIRSGGFTSSCQDPEAFESSLFHSGSSKSTKRACEREQVVIDLGQGVSIKLNEAGLKFLTLSLQNKQNYVQLIDLVQNSDAEWDLTYEMPAHDALCLDQSHSTDGFGHNTIRLTSKYSYSLKSNIWTPKSSSLLIFDPTQTKLLIAIQLYLLHAGPFKPWSSSHHLLDFSACKLGPRESALVRIEYPLTKDSEHLKQVEAPQELIRAALANYLQTSYSISLTRIPSIEVRILDDLVLLDIHLLDRWDLLSDSDLLPVLGAAITEEQYLTWLREATRSVLVASGASCAEYCQHYQCTQYVFCKSSLACYIFHPTSRSSKVNGSFTGTSDEGLHCEAFNVLSIRLEIGGFRRKSSWSLEEIVESLVDSCQVQADDYYNHYGFLSWPSSIYRKTGDHVEDSIKFARSDVMQPSLHISATLVATDNKQTSKLVSLYPKFAHYSYEIPSSNSLKSSLFGDKTALDYENDQVMMEKTKTSLAEPSLAYFRIAFNGFQFIDKASVVQHSEDLHLLDHLDATRDRAHLVLNLVGHQLNDCTRHCLADIGCLSFSYCSINHRCVLTSLSQTEIETRVSSLNENEPQVRPNLIVRTAEHCLIAVRTFSDQFERFERRNMATILSGRLMEQVVDMFNAESGEDCATRCALNRASGLQGENTDNGDTCLSYDFCVANSDPTSKSATSCILFKHRLVLEYISLDLSDLGGSMLGQVDDSQPKLIKDQNLTHLLTSKLKMDKGSVCWHYVRNFLADFNKINNRRLDESLKALVLRNYVATDEKTKLEGSLEQVNSDSISGEKEAEGGGEGVSLIHCARLCEESPDCGAFEYCAVGLNEAPNGLYLSCSIGAIATLEMAPPVARAGRAGESPIKGKQETVSSHKHQEVALLSKSRICSVYTYKSLALILSHKKKNLVQLGAKILDEAHEESQSTWLNLVRLDLLVLLVFFAIGFLVRDLNPNQFGFQRLRKRSNTAAGNIGQPVACSPGQDICIDPRRKFIGTVEHWRGADENHFQLATLSPERV